MSISDAELRTILEKSADHIDALESRLAMYETREVAKVAAARASDIETLQTLVSEVTDDHGLAEKVAAMDDRGRSVLRDLLERVPTTKLSALGSPAGRPAHGNPDADSAFLRWVLS